MLGRGDVEQVAGLGDYDEAVAGLRTPPASSSLTGDEAVAADDDHLARLQTFAAAADGSRGQRRVRCRDDHPSGRADRLYFRQLLSGRDFAVDDPLASQMVNFVYAVGDRTTGECVLVDPAYAVAELLAAVAADGMRVTGVIASHYHPDHIGGSMMGYTIEGVPALLEHVDVPGPRAGRRSAVGVAHDRCDGGRAVSAPARRRRRASAGSSVELVHTPGHTPGSQCLLVDGRLVSGDTLFLDGCGRTDLPGGDPEAMYDSLQRLAALPDGTVVFPGHRYSIPSSATMSSIREQNYVFKPSSKEQWMTMFGR